MNHENHQSLLALPSFDPWAHLTSAEFAAAEDVVVSLATAGQCTLTS